jgi:hypothetical protein
VKVSFKRTGGFAGLSLLSEIDCAHLPPAKCKEIEQLVGLLRAAGQPSAKPSANAIPDAFQYEVTVADDHGEHKFRAGDTEMSDELQKVVDWLTHHRTQAG